MIRLEITTADAQKTVQLISEAVSPRSILTVIGARLESYVDESFKTSGRGQWRELATSTLQLRRHGGNAPLQDSGRYRQSWVQDGDRQTFVEVGTNLKTTEGVSLGKIHELGTRPYAIRIRRARMLAAQTRAGGWFHFGTEVHHPGVPARPVLPTQPVAERMITAVIEAMLTRVLASKGG